MTRQLPEPPPEILAAARERSQARAARDWPRADALRAMIEAAGWRVVDRGTHVRLVPATPPTLEEGGVVRYGSASAVPSELDSPPSFRFTVELVADDAPDVLAVLLAALRAHAPAGTQVIVVANDPSPGQAARLAAESPDVAPVAGVAPEVIWTSERLGHAAARNVGLARARGALVVLADGSLLPAGDALTPLEAALADPAVAVAGGRGFVTVDLRRLEPDEGPAVDVVDLAWLAFRREELSFLGPLDERFVVEHHLATWWSLVLRDGADGAPPRRAVRLALPLVPRPGREAALPPDADRERLKKRAFYRVLDRFRERRDLLSPTPAGAARPGADGPGGFVASARRPR